MPSALLALSFFYYSVTSAQPIVDQQPVSNKNWSIFLQAIHNDPALSKKLGQSMTPDQWGKQQTSPKNQDAPVVGVSWHQALAYCEWRSVTATYLLTHAKIAPYQTMQMANASAKTLVTYRLPSEQEWKKFASHFTSKANSGISFHCVRSIKRVA
ncbi:formylglycine-generating enzyme family protein [Spirosoma foliorum]|uniref:SUMF1/EgtB/PvdO family nonheme iron enzyme n=1 Tax=Spirosoma foliorum TaxID=2710596 RepID=A0A7G5H3U0_9BACT|nr:SUMF1/EgtB/PvdO family nonheme iron enzyme [Spirosoma foliorum]QMW05782.1 SUMF1/EgtB/PvdO family nonheme iron enzyme [Spirosoma foliorum]